MWTPLKFAHAVAVVQAVCLSDRHAFSACGRRGLRRATGRSDPKTMYWRPLYCRDLQGRIAVLPRCPANALALELVRIPKTTAKSTRRKRTTKRFPKFETAASPFSRPLSPSFPKRRSSPRTKYTQIQCTRALCVAGFERAKPGAILNFMQDAEKTPVDTAASSGLEHSSRQFEALLIVSEAIAQQRDLKALFHDLSIRLHDVLQFDFLVLVLHNAARNTMRLHILETNEPEDRPEPSEYPVEQSPSGWVWENQQPFVTLDTDADTRYPMFMEMLKRERVRTIAILPLTTAQHRLGALCFGRYVPQSVTETEVDFMKRVAAQVAVAVDNALNFEAAQAYQKQLARERDRLQVLLEINNLLVSTRDVTSLFQGIVSSLKPVIHHDYTSLALLGETSGLIKIHALDIPVKTIDTKTEFTVSMEGSPAGQAISSGEVLVARGAEIDRFHPDVTRYLREQGVEVLCCVPLVTHGRTFGTINFASRNPQNFSTPDVDLLRQVASQVAIALENALAFKEIDALKDKLAVEKLYLEEEIRTEISFDEIIGESPVLRRALAQVELAAPASTTVLILGETGTGKEIIARAIHNLSPRRERTFVKVNCAAIPAGLLESELFGHERGAFTGAVTQKVGRFEFADRGTLFLDEVGDLPLELQPKLLRVLQEQEFERLGGNRTIHVDVRVVAATNFDLAQLVAEKKFRSDLYYRLNVFPILIPPLRERPEDVPLLVRYFVQRFSRLQNKTVEYIPAPVMEAMTNYSWPGNVRELENLIERAVLLSPGKELRVPLAEFKENSVPSALASAAMDLPQPVDAMPAASFNSGSISTLDDAQRQHITQVLKQTQWRIAGPRGAAAILGIKRTTLQARMRKLGIKRPI
jgi:formate hydrogenlyase transcriptional activator